MDEQTPLTNRKSGNLLNWIDPFELVELVAEVPGMLFDGLGAIIEFLVGALLEGLGGLLEGLGSIF